MTAERLFLALPARTAPVRPDEPTRLLATAAAIAVRAAAAIRREISRRRTRTLLQGLTDRELADIGLTRSDVHGYGLDGPAGPPRRPARAKVRPFAAGEG